MRERGYFSVPRPSRVLFIKISQINLRCRVAYHRCGTVSVGNTFEHCARSVRSDRESMKREVSSFEFSRNVKYVILYDYPNSKGDTRAVCLRGNMIGSKTHTMFAEKLAYSSSYIVLKLMHIGIGSFCNFGFFLGGGAFFWGGHFFICSLIWY